MCTKSPTYQGNPSFDVVLHSLRNQVTSLVVVAIIYLRSRKSFMPRRLWTWLLLPDRLKTPNRTFFVFSSSLDTFCLLFIVPHPVVFKILVFYLQIFSVHRHLLTHHSLTERNWWVCWYISVTWRFWHLRHVVLDFSITLGQAILRYSVTPGHTVLCDFVTLSHVTSSGIWSFTVWQLGKLTNRKKGARF